MSGLGLNLLSLDGGGLRGLSSLLILKTLMQRIDPKNAPKPCDYFDLIGGTSTGGLMAIMLGRLRMNIDESIEAYSNLMDRVLHNPKSQVTTMGKVQNRYDMLEVKHSFTELITRYGFEEDALLYEPNGKCKILVCTTRKETSEAIIFRSYTSTCKNVKIWEAACATLATSSFFDHYADGEFGREFFGQGNAANNNPIQEVWSESQIMISPKALIDNLNALISIGAGNLSLQPSGGDFVDIATILNEIASENEKTAKIFQCGHGVLDARNLYFRFNVLNGLEGTDLEDVSERDAIISATKRYLDSKVVATQVKICGKPHVSLGMGCEITSVAWTNSANSEKCLGLFSRYIWHLRGWRPIRPIVLLTSYIMVDVVGSYMFPEETRQHGLSSSPAYWTLFVIFVSIITALKIVLIYGFLPFRFQDFLAAWAIRVRPSVPWILLACVWLFTMVIGTPGLVDNDFLNLMLGSMLIRLFFITLYSFANQTIEPLIARQQLLPSLQHVCISFFYCGFFCRVSLLFFIFWVYSLSFTNKSVLHEYSV